MLCSPRRTRSSLTWLTTWIFALHSSHLRRVQLRTEPLSQVESSRTVKSRKLSLQSNWLLRNSELFSFESFAQMSSGQFAIITLDFDRQWKRCSGSFEYVTLNEQSENESSNTRIGTSYCRNIIRVDPQATAIQSPKLPVASISTSSYRSPRLNTSQSEDTAGRPVLQTRMTVLVPLGRFGSIAWMQMRLPESEKSSSNLSGMTYWKVGKTLVMGASLVVQIQSRSCSSIWFGGLTRMSSPRAMAIFHLQKPGSLVAGDSISASLKTPRLVTSRMRTRSRHWTKRTEGWKSEVQTSMGEKYLTPTSSSMRESMRQTSRHSRSWWSQHWTMSKSTISFTQRSTTTRYCPRNSIDWTFPSYPSSKMIGRAPSSALRSTSQINTSFGSSSQRIAARWMYCPPQQWKRLAVRLEMRKLMWGAQPLSIQWTSEVQGTVMHLLKWVTLVQSWVQRQSWVSSRESYCSWRMKVQRMTLGFLFHQLMIVLFCWRMKLTGGSGSSLSTMPQVMLEPNTQRSRGMKSWPGQLAQQVSGSLRPVGQRARVLLSTTMYLQVKVQTSESFVYSLMLSAFTMKLNSLFFSAGFVGFITSRGEANWYITSRSVSIVMIRELARLRSTKAWKLEWGMAAQAFRYVLLPRVKTQVDWQAEDWFLSSVRLAVSWVTTYSSFTQRSWIQAPSGMEYLVTISGLIWLVQSISQMAWSWARTRRNSLTVLLEQTPSLVKPESVRYRPAMTMVWEVVMSNLMTPLWQSRMQMSPRQTSKSMIESLSWWRNERSITRMVQGLRGLLTERISQQVLWSNLSTCSAKYALMRQWQPSQVSSRILRWQICAKGTYMSFFTIPAFAFVVVFTYRNQFCSPKVPFCTQSTSASCSFRNQTASKHRMLGSVVTTASLERSGIASTAPETPQRRMVLLPKTLMVTRELPQLLPSWAKWQFRNPD